MATTSSWTVALLFALSFLVSGASAIAEVLAPASPPPSHSSISSIHELNLPPQAISTASLADSTVPGPGYLLPSADHHGERIMVCKNDGDPTREAAAKKEEWPWRRAGVADYLSVAVLAGGALYFENKNGGEPGKAHWTSRNDFDEGIRDALRLGSRDAREAAHQASNVIMGVMIAAPVLETGAVLGLRDSKWDATFQTEMINLEAFTFTALVSSSMQNLIARERPFARNCTDGDCEGVQKNRSMPSGHVAFAFTGAGLLCTHHKYQNFYGDDSTDSAICATGLGLAAVDGVLRILSDRHYATDVLAGTAIGLFSGFVLPRILFYPWHSPPSDQKVEEKETPFIKNLVFAPEIYRDGGGVNCAFKF